MYLRWQCIHRYRCEPASVLPALFCRVVSWQSGHFFIDLFWPILLATLDNEIYIASHWSSTKLKEDKVESREHPQVIIYNIGAGAAKEINIKWDFDWSKANS